jgi:hypothetical protein
MNHNLSRFQVAGNEPSCPFGDGLAKDIIFSSTVEELRGSPSLVGRGIANPMSERTRGFEIASLLLFEKEEGTEVPLPAPLFKTLQFVSVDELHKS